MITLEIYPESKKVLLSFLYVCLTFACDMDYAKHDKRVNKKSFYVPGMSKEHSSRSIMCNGPFYTSQAFQIFFIQAKINISLAARLIMANLVNTQSFIRIRCKVSKI